MPLTPNFSASQNYGTITDFTLEDTSTGSDTITGRLVYIRDVNGDYVVPDGTTTDYIFWPYADDTIDIEGVLDQDYCWDITVVWYSGSSPAYTKTILCLFEAYTKLSLRQLTQALAANRIQLSNKNFWQNKQRLRGLLEDAEFAVELINDQTIATFYLQECKTMTDNPSLFY